MIPVALQFFSLHQELEKDFAGTIQKIAKIGYKNLEFGFHAGGSLPLKERQKILGDAGLKVLSMHINWEVLTGQFDEAIEMAAAYQTTDIVLPWMPPANFISVKSCTELGEKLAALGAKFRAAGIHFGYHNHHFDYALLEGRPAMEWLLEPSPPRDVTAQIDVYWVYAAGGDPVKAITRMGARTRSLHIKDGDKATMLTTSLGRGKVDLSAIFDVCEKNNIVELYVVEQEAYTSDPFEELQLSFQYLKKLGKV